MSGRKFISGGGDGRAMIGDRELQALYDDETGEMRPGAEAVLASHVAVWRARREQTGGKRE